MTDQALAKSTVDQLRSLQRVTLRFDMDLLELDGGCGSEKSRRYSEDEAEGKAEMKQSSVGVICRRWIVREWVGNYDLRHFYQLLKFCLDEPHGTRPARPASGEIFPISTILGPLELHRLPCMFH